MSTEESDVRRVITGTENFINYLSLGLYPLFIFVFSRLFSALRRIALALLGGVPAEKVDNNAASEKQGASAPVVADDQRQRPEPRWSHVEVVDCLRRIAEDRKPLQSVLGRLPADVRQWLGSISAADATDLRSLPRPELRRQYDEWLAVGKDWAAAKTAFAPRPPSPKPSRDDDRHDASTDDVPRGPRR